MLWFRRLNAIAVVWCFCVVVFGAFVRLSDAGLGCPDWPGCYGHVTVPTDTQTVEQAEAQYPDRPVQAHKAWKEMIHRYLASTLGLFILALAVMSWRLRNRAAPLGLALALVVLVMFQGMLGMWTVTWQLKPLVVTGHLFGGLTTLSLLFLQGIRARQPEDAPLASGATDWTPRLRRFALVALLVVICQIFLGGWTSTNYAALACTDFPTCQGQWWPQTDYKTAYTLWHGLDINYEYGILDATARVTIHMTHRLGALIVTSVLLVLAALLMGRKRSPGQHSLGVAILCALALQVTLGISIVELHLPLPLATAHNAGAALLLLTMVAVNAHAWRRRSS